MYRSCRYLCKCCVFHAVVVSRRLLYLHPTGTAFHVTALLNDLVLFCSCFPSLGIYLIEFGTKMNAAVNWYAWFGQQVYFIYLSTNELYFYACTCTFKMTVEIHTCCICSLGSRCSSASVWLGVCRRGWHSAIISVEWNRVLKTGVEYRFIDALHVNIMFL